MELQFEEEHVALDRSPALQFEFLTEQHIDVIHSFGCNDEPSVARFLRENALELDRLGMTRTRLYFDDSQSLVGFFTLFVSTTHIDHAIMLEKGLPVPEEFCLEFPAITLYYLGVDSRFRNRKVGRALFLDVLQVCEWVSQNSGCRFLMIEALESSKWFYDHYDLITLDCKIEQDEEYNQYRLYTMALPLYEIDEEIPLKVHQDAGVAS